MFTVFSPAFSSLLLRLTLGGVLIAHSIYLKLMIFSLEGTAQYFTNLGLPYSLAYLVFTIESLAGVALVLGIYSRFFALLVTPVLLGATWVHATNGWLFTNTGGGWEYPLVLTLLALVQAGLGDDKFTLSQHWKKTTQQSNP